MLISNQLFLKPSPLLQDVIDNYWFSDNLSTDHTCRSNHSQVQIPILGIDWYFSYHNTINFWSINDQSVGAKNSLLIGPREIYKVLHMFDFSIPFRGLRVRFKPMGFGKIFHISASELSNSLHSMDEVLGNNIKNLQDRLENAQTHLERKKILDQHFIKKMILKNNKPSRDARFKEAYSRIRNQRGNLRITELLRQLNFSERTLERDFRNFLGLTPKDVCKIFRISNLIRSILAKDSVNWTDLAYENGYFDQAHLINEFKQATTVTPEWFHEHKFHEILVVNGLLIFLTTEMIREMVDYLNQRSRMVLKENKGWIYLNEMTIPPV
jgi:AraC-like DNA-binding protein